LPSASDEFGPGGGRVATVESTAPLASRDGRVAPAMVAPPSRLPSSRARAALRVVALYLVTMFVVVTVVFAIPRAMPGDPIAARQDPSDALFVSDANARKHLLAYYDLDHPLVVQYVHYLGRIAHGDLGWSISNNAKVSRLIAKHLSWTLLLMGTALAASSAVSFLAGVSAGWSRGRRADRLLVVVLTGMRSIPEYALATVLLIVFAVLLPVFPLYGAKTPFAEYQTVFAHVGDIARHLALPALTLTLSQIGTKFLLVRNTTISILGEDYMVLARAKGLAVRRQEFHHAGRNALLPFLTVLGIQVGFAVGGAVFIESVFAYPGMGTLILTAVSARDYPVLEGCFLTLATTVLLANLAIELVYARLDPRVGAL
jgi:peptide/nickel transport system permease protein